MTESHELTVLFQQLQSLCRKNNIPLDPDYGSEMLCHGLPCVVIAVKDGAIAVVEEMTSMPVDPSEVTYIDEWEQNPACIFMPSVEELLYMMRMQTTLFPTLTPGVQSTREVWQLQHPRIEPVVASSLREVLVRAAIAIASLDEEPAESAEA